MSRLFLLFLSCFCLPSILQAQTLPSEEPLSPQTLSHQTGPRNARTLWDLEFAYNLSDSTQGDRSVAAAYYFAPSNEFWISRWNTDTLYRLDRNGSLIEEFTISGLSGTRSFTSDGSYLYAGAAGGTIFRIDPNTQQLSPPHINLNTSVTARHCSYDPSADNGNGGFWIGNFSTDLVLVDFAGDVLASIPQSVHGVTGMYGSALDTSSANGPYLWIFHRGGANDTQISQIRLINGNFTGLTRDVTPDLGNITAGGVAGGLFISYGYLASQPIIGGVIQSGGNDNVLFAYELEEPAGEAVDLRIGNGNTSLGYSAIPNSQISPMRFRADATNQGIRLVDTVYMDYRLQFNGSTVWSEQRFERGLNVGFTEPFQSSSYTPNLGLGRYEFRAIASPGSNQVDQNKLDDTLRFSIEVTDSIMARAQAPYNTGGYTVSSTLWAYAGANYTLFRSDALSGIHISLVNPTAGDTTYALLFSLDANGEPLQLLDQGPIVLLQDGVEDYFLPFSQVQNLAAGTYCFAVYEGENTGIGLKQSRQLYTAGVNYFFRNGNWSASGIPTARAINPVFQMDPPLSSNSPAPLDLRVWPNPAQSHLNIAGDLSEEEPLRWQLFHNDGRLLQQGQLPQGQNTLSVEQLPQGLYYLELFTEKGRQVQPFMKQ